MIAVDVTVNGAATARRWSRASFSRDFLRHRLGLTGTHVGCEHGVCGACTVKLDGVAVRSCLLLARRSTAARSPRSRASRDGPLTPLQEAFRRHHALQCGFCTPGILIAADDLLARAPADARGDRRHALRPALPCTGYTPIVDAIAEVAGA